MELESVQNFLANSVDLDGPAADELKKILETAVARELKHARRLAKRIKVLDGRVPGSLELPREQNFLQPPMDQRDFAAVLRGALTATDAAIAHYQATVQMTEGLDYVTQDLLIDLLTADYFTNYLCDPPDFIVYRLAYNGDIAVGQLAVFPAAHFERNDGIIICETVD
jgi:bacterioferritin